MICMGGIFLDYRRESIVDIPLNARDMIGVDSLPPMSAIVVVRYLVYPINTAWREGEKKVTEARRTPSELVLVRMCSSTDPRDQVVCTWVSSQAQRASPIHVPFINASTLSFHFFKRIKLL